LSTHHLPFHFSFGPEYEVSRNNGSVSALGALL
jgi:hypothetical protein